MRSVKRGQKEIDPMFFIPDGVDELVYAEGEDFLFDEEVSEEETDAFAEEEFDSETVDDTDYVDNPDTPQILGVLNPQTIRTAATGAEVVDVVLDVEDIEDVTNYEVRIVKT